MTMLKLTLVILVSIATYHWVNGSCGEELTLGDLLPFSKRGHSSLYNYLSVAVAVLMLFSSFWKRKGDNRDAL